MLDKPGSIPDTAPIDTHKAGHTMITFALVSIAAAFAVIAFEVRSMRAAERAEFSARVAKARYERAKAQAKFYRGLGYLEGEIRAVAEMQYWHRCA